MRKALTKVTFQAGNVKNIGKLLEWSGNIINHFWHCCQTCESDLMKLKVHNVISTAMPFTYIIYLFTRQSGQAFVSCAKYA